MKVTGDIYGVSKVYNNQKSVGKVDKTSAIAPKKDIVSISSSAMDCQTVSRALRDVPDVRMNKVEEFKHVYNSGAYNISGNEIVEKLGKSILDKKV